MKHGLLASRRAFTLVELLVVVVILAILMAVLTPVIQSALRRGRAATCRANLRQNVHFLIDLSRDSPTGLTVFRDGAGSFPYRPYMLVGDRAVGGSQSDAFAKSMHCPEMPKPAMAHWNSFGINFASNPAINAQWFPAPNPEGAANLFSLAVDKITSPAAYPLLMDSLTSTGEEIFRVNYGSNHAALRHDRLLNAAFADGRAAPVPLAECREKGLAQVYEWRSVGDYRLVTAP